MMEISQEIILACIIVIISGIALIHGNISPQDFITILGMVFSFLAGYKIGAYKAFKKYMGVKK